MLNLKVVMFLCLSVTVVFSENNQTKLKYELKSCLLETKMSNDELLAMLMVSITRQLKIPKTQVQKCMFGCMMRKSHMIDNGKVSAEVLTRYALNFYGTTEYNRCLIIKNVEHIVDVCANKDNLPTEECALAGIIVTCIVGEAHKAGLTDESGHLVPKLNTYDKSTEI